MEVQELRIGNCIMCECRGEYKPHTIKSIWYNDEEKLYYVELDNSFQCNINGITPIPITEELLLKNGFGDPYYGVYGRKDFEITKRSDKWWVSWNEGWDFLFTIKYLHQLQNAYYLVTWKDLEIKL